MFKIRMGIPEMQKLWNNLEKKFREKSANKNEIKLFLASCKLFFKTEPRHSLSWFVYS